MFRILIGLMAAAGLLLAGPATAEPTDITVRVISKGGKFIGTSLGGARIVLRDVETGELLATGVTAGTTGDTELIMQQPHTRGTPVATPDAAAYTATIDIDRPTHVAVTAYGPLAQQQAANIVSASMWVMPGRDVTGGDGWVLEMPGLVVDVLHPPAHIRVTNPAEGIMLRANVMMMCGCPIEPGGLWDAENFEIAARIHRDGEFLEEVPLAYAGTPSQFSATLDMTEPGTYDATIYAFEPENGNTGLDRTTFIIPEP